MTNKIDLELNNFVEKLKRSNKDAEWHISKSFDPELKLIKAQVELKIKFLKEYIELLKNKLKNNQQLIAIELKLQTIKEDILNDMFKFHIDIPQENDGAVKHLEYYSNSTSYLLNQIKKIIDLESDLKKIHKNV